MDYKGESSKASADGVPFSQTALANKSTHDFVDHSCACRRTQDQIRTQRSHEQRPITLIRPPARIHLRTSEPLYLSISEGRQPEHRQSIAKVSHPPRLVSCNRLHRQAADRYALWRKPQ